MTLVAFDFDGTLSDSEMTVLLGNQLGIADEMEAITAKAMNDEIDYAQSVRDRIALLDGMDDAQAQAAFDEVVLRPGAADVIQALNDAGVHTAILTGGYDRGVEAALAKDDVLVDDIVANRVVVEDGTLTGGVAGPLIEGTKDEALANLAETQAVDMAATIAVGDGANDLPMLEAAGLAVGFDPKPNVEPAADVVVETMDELREVFVDEGVLDA